MELVCTPTVERECDGPEPDSGKLIGINVIVALALVWSALCHKHGGAPPPPSLSVLSFVYTAGG